MSFYDVTVRGLPGGGAASLSRPLAVHALGVSPQLTDLRQWYTREFKDPLLQDPPTWFKSFLFCELVFQLPFFPIATYAFLRGWYLVGKSHFGF